MFHHYTVNDYHFIGTVAETPPPTTLVLVTGGGSSNSKESIFKFNPKIRPRYQKIDTVHKLTINYESFVKERLSPKVPVYIQFLKQLSVHYNLWYADNPEEIGPGKHKYLIMAVMADSSTISEEDIKKLLIGENNMFAEAERDGRELHPFFLSPVLHHRPVDRPEDSEKIIRPRRCYHDFKRFIDYNYDRYIIDDKRINNALREQRKNMLINLPSFLIPRIENLKSDLYFDYKKDVQTTTITDDATAENLDSAQIYYPTTKRRSSTNLSLSVHQDVADEYNRLRYIVIDKLVNPRQTFEETIKDTEYRINDFISRWLKKNTYAVIFEYPMYSSDFKQYCCCSSND